MSLFGAVVLDESSILKALDGKTRQRLLRICALAWTTGCAAPYARPNDIAEIANHAEFLGVMRRVEMLASFFIHDDTGWRLKRHAETAFYRWMASWAASVRRPSDLGYSDDGYILPVAHRFAAVGGIWLSPKGSFLRSSKVFRAALPCAKGNFTQRVEAAAELVNGDAQPYIVWCG